MIKFKAIAVLAIAWVLANPSISAQADTSFAAEQPTLSMLFAGDFMQHDPQIEAARCADGSYDYRHYFEHLGELVQGVDVAVANLEVTLAGEPYRGYPQFSAPDSYAEAIRDVGFDILTTANNHSNDRGPNGLKRTIDVLDSLGIAHLGTYIDSAAWRRDYPHMLEQNGFRIAMLNYTYGTNGIPTRLPRVANRLDQELVKHDIRTAKAADPDVVIAITHWGGEYRSFPDQYQRTWAKLLFAEGVDIIIGGHPHWVQPMELKDGQLITWSLGNVVSNQRREHTNGGAMIQFTLERNADGTVGITEAGYHLHWVQVLDRTDSSAWDGGNRYRMLPISLIEATGLELSASDSVLVNRFVRNERGLLQEENIGVPEYRFDPEHGRYFLKE